MIYCQLWCNYFPLRKVQAMAFLEEFFKIMFMTIIELHTCVLWTLSSVYLVRKKVLSIQEGIDRRNYCSEGRTAHCSYKMSYRRKPDVHIDLLGTPANIKFYFGNNKQLNIHDHYKNYHSMRKNVWIYDVEENFLFFAEHIFEKWRLVSYIENEKMYLYCCVCVILANFPIVVTS